MMRTTLLCVDGRTNQWWWNSRSLLHPHTTKKVTAVSSHLFGAIPAHRHVSVACVRASERPSTHLAVNCRVGRCQQLAAQLVHEGDRASLKGARPGQSLNGRTLYEGLQTRGVSCLHSRMLALREHTHKPATRGRRALFDARKAHACMHGRGADESKQTAGLRLQVRSKAMRGSQVTLTTASFFLGVA
jgi:hypothetical protein